MLEKKKYIRAPRVNQTFQIPVGRSNHLAMGDPHGKQVADLGFPQHFLVLLNIHF